MKIGASSFAGAIPDLKEEVGSIELYIPKLRIYEGTELVRSKVKTIKDELSSFDLTTSIHAPYFSDSANYPLELVIDTSDINDKNSWLLEDSIMMAYEFDSNVVVIHPGRKDLNQDFSFENMVCGLSRILKFAEDMDVMIGIENKENTDSGNLCCFAPELIELVEKINSPNLGITFDIGHANLTCGGNQSKLREYAKQIKDYVIHVHVHDNFGHFTEQYRGDQHIAPGEGNVDFSVLSELNFNGVYNLELFSVNDVKKGKKKLEESLF